jgi:hypothetical protein
MDLPPTWPLRPTTSEPGAEDEPDDE